jgi:hypothetical protein
MITPKVNFKSSNPHNYFKVGCYTQSNAKFGDSASAFGEVWVHSVDILHKLCSILHSIRFFPDNTVGSFNLFTMAWFEMKVSDWITWPKT